MNVFEAKAALVEEVKDFAAVGIRAGCGGLIIDVWGTPPADWMPYTHYEGWPVETLYIGEVKAQ
jgi:hypothetical protein